MKSKQEETRPISALAKKAAATVQQQFITALQAEMNAVANDTLESMGLSSKDGWIVDFGRGLAVRVYP
jgi:phage-related tail protein